MSIKGDTLRLQGQLESKFDKREIRPQRFRAIMGDGTGAVKVPGKRNYVYVRRLGRGLIEECLNNKAPARDGLPIIAGCSHESPDLLQVLEVDWTSFAEPGSYAYAPPHHESHEFRNVYGGDDVVWVQKQQVLPLLAHPTSPISMSVVVLDDWYPWDTGWHYFEEVTSADLTAHIPALAGQARYVLISIDGATEALQYTIGGLFPILLPPADAENMIPAPPLGSIPIVGVYLTGMTTAIDWENLYDLRLFNQPVGGSVSPGPHALLDTVVHSDTVTNAPTRGSLVLANATPAWDELVHPGGAGYALTTDANDVVWDQTPLWTGEHSFQAGIAFVGATGANSVTIPDNIAQAMHVVDTGAFEYMRIVSTNAQPATVFNFGEEDIDFRVAALGITDALFVQGSTGFVGVGRNAPEGHLDVYDITVNTTISYYGIHNEHVKTLGATDYLDVLEGIHNQIEFNQNGAEIGRFTGISSRTILTSGSVGDGGARGMRGIYNYLWMEDATCTVTDDVQGLFTEVDLGGGTIGDDVMGYHIYVHLRAGLTSVGGDVFGTRIYLHAETDPAGTVYAIYWWEGDNIDYGIYQDGTAPNLFGGNLVLDDGVGDSPQVQFIGGSNNDTYTIFCEDDAVAGNSDLVVTMPATDADARFIWRNSTPADVAYVDAAGNADFEGHLAVGASAAVAANYTLHVSDLNLNVVTEYRGIYAKHVKTLGATDHNDAMYGFRVEFEYNQPGGTISNMYGGYIRAYLANGEVGSAAGVRDLRGLHVDAIIDGGRVYNSFVGTRMMADLNAGQIDANAYGNYMRIDQEVANTVAGDMYGNYIWVDADGTVTGSVYMLYIQEISNVDYCIYQAATGAFAPSYLGGALAVGGTVGALAQLHVDQSAAGGVIPALLLDQADLSEEFIDFVCASTGAGDPVDTATAVGANYARLRVAVNGAFKYIQLHDA